MSEIEKRLPQGAVQGLCSSAATLSGLSMAFLGFWGFSDDSSWKTTDFLSLAPALLGIALLAAVPWLVTKPAEDDGTKNVLRGRKLFFGGVAAILIAVIATFFT